MRVLWHSAAPWVGSGYGQQTSTFVPRIEALGHEVAISANSGLIGTVIDWHDISVFPTFPGRPYGNDLLTFHAREFLGPDPRAGVVITLIDVWTIPDPEGLRAFRLGAWTPIDHDPLSPIVAEWFEASGATPIAMSRFGERAFYDRGLDARYIPHGVDCNIFTPGDKGAARDRLSLPGDAFVIAIVAANRGKPICRKGLAEQIAAFAALRRVHSDAFLYLHTEPAPETGIDIRAVLRAYEVPEHAVRWTDGYRYARGLTPAEMAEIYQAADLYSNTAYGEGFGIGIVEAQACGRPVVVTDFTSMPELCGAGWVVECQRWWHHGGGSFFAIPNISAITDAYLAAYDDGTAHLTSKAREFALNYDADDVTSNYWKPVLEDLGTA
jgi:glycosyltransferase involved in cell wall biosynthesis